MGFYFSIIKKITIGYLVIVFFSVLAIGFALNSLHDNTLRTEKLVGTQVHAFTLLRDIRQNLIAQQGLEKQILILRDQQFIDLFDARTTELGEILGRLQAAPLSEALRSLPEAIGRYHIQARKLVQWFEKKDWAAAKALSKGTTAPQRSQLFELLTDIRLQHQDAFDEDLRELSHQSDRAYRLTLLMTVIGILLSAPVALTITISIHRSIQALKTGTQNIAEGNFDSQLGIRSNDEFGQLALDFASMARKLSELKQLNLDANPLTQLPGNLAIDRELERRIQENIPFAHLYIDLDNFKAYGDRYGYQKGSDVINHVGNLLQKVVEEHGNSSDLIGHIGGDDYVVITDPPKAEDIAQALIREFDAFVPQLYNEKDRNAGFFTGTDRYGIMRTFPLLTISIAITLSENMKQPSLLAISHDSAKMKEHLKRLKGSNYLTDRRKHL